MKKAVVDIVAGLGLQLQDEVQVDLVEGGVDAPGGDHNIVDSVDGAERVVAPREDGREGDDFVQDLEVCVVGSSLGGGTKF